jgi:hypothetical protein
LPLLLLPRMGARRGIPRSALGCCRPHDRLTNALASTPERIAACADASERGSRRDAQEAGLARAFGLLPPAKCSSIRVSGLGSVLLRLLLLDGEPLLERLRRMEFV